MSQPSLFHCNALTNLWQIFDLTVNVGGGGALWQLIRGVRPCKFTTVIWQLLLCTEIGLMLMYLNCRLYYRFIFSHWSRPLMPHPRNSVYPREYGDRRMLSGMLWGGGGLESDINAENQDIQGKDRFIWSCPSIFVQQVNHNKRFIGK